MAFAAALAGSQEKISNQPDFPAQGARPSCRSVAKVIIVLDTKYYTDIVTEREAGHEKFIAAHLYQMYAYLRTQEHLSDALYSAVGVLLYPTVNAAVSQEISLPNKMCGNVYGLGRFGICGCVCSPRDPHGCEYRA
jgi:hypothetical protein